MVKYPPICEKWRGSRQRGQPERDLSRACREKTNVGAPSEPEIHNSVREVYLHQTEHRVFELDGVETLLPVSHSRVDVEPGGGRTERFSLAIYPPSMLYVLALQNKGLKIQI